MGSSSQPNANEMGLKYQGQDSPKLLQRRAMPPSLNPNCGKTPGRTLRGDVAVTRSQIQQTKFTQTEREREREREREKKKQRKHKRGTSIKQRKIERERERASESERKEESKRTERDGKPHIRKSKLHHTGSQCYAGSNQQVFDWLTCWQMFMKELLCLWGVLGSWRCYGCNKVK